MTKIISAPGDLIVASSNSVDVRFAGIELSVEVPAGSGEESEARGMRVYLEGIRSPETQRLDQLYLEEIESWVMLRKRHGAAAAGSPPAMPGQLALSPVKPEISDDVGTKYRCVAGQVAGTGTEWDGSWVYLPNPPKNAGVLTLKFKRGEEPTGTSCQIQLD